MVGLEQKAAAVTHTGFSCSDKAHVSGGKTFMRLNGNPKLMVILKKQKNILTN